MSCMIVAEVGQNHNGDLNLAKKIISMAKSAGCDAVKFQKRTPKLCVPKDVRKKMKETPWGKMSYLKYREKLEFGFEEYNEIDCHCQDLGIEWFVSVWDIPSLDFMLENYPGNRIVKIPSAMVKHLELVKAVKDCGLTPMISTGMSTIKEIEQALKILDHETMVAACTSSYPCATMDINLSFIETLRDRYPQHLVGYSGHELGIQITEAAVALGADFVERHVTMDRTMWGSDHAASLEPSGLQKMCRDIRIIESAMGDGIKRIYDSEKDSIERLKFK